MNYKRFLLVAVTTLVTTSLQSVVVVPGMLPAQQVLAQTTEARKAEADRLFNQGIQQIEANQLESALQSWKQALQIYREINDRAGVGDVLNNLGLAYHRLGDSKKAIDFLQQSLPIAKKLGDRAGVGNALNNLGLAYRRLGDFKKAIEYHKQALVIFKELGDRVSLSMILGNLGGSYAKLGDYKKSINVYQQSLVIFQESGDRPSVAGVLTGLGNNYGSLGEHKKAIEMHQRSLAIAKELGHRAGVARALNNLGIDYRYLGYYQKAINLYQESLTIEKQLNNRAGVASTLNNLGNAYYSIGKFKKAIEVFQKSLAIDKELGDRASEGKVLGNLGNAYFGLGEYDKAIRQYQKSLEIAEELEDRASVDNALRNLGNIYSFLEDNDTASEFHKKRIAIAKQLGKQINEATRLQFLGGAYFSQGDYRSAIKFYERSLASAKIIGNRTIVVEALNRLGLAYHSLGDYQKAIRNYQQSLVIAEELGNRISQGNALGNLGVTYDLLEEYKTAIKYYKQHLAIAKETDHIRDEGVVLNNLGYSLFKSGNLAEAEQVLKQGIEIHKSQRGRLKNWDNAKVSIFDEQVRTYLRLQQVLIVQNKTDEALEVAESGRARAFVDLLTSRIDPNNDVSSSTDATIEQIKQIAKIQNTTFVQYSMIGDNFKLGNKQQYKQSQLYIWVIKPTGEVTFRKADLKPLWQKENTTLSELVSTTRKSLGVGDNERSIFDVKVKNSVNEKIQKESLQKLHQLLVKPIADLLPTDPNQRVTFVPQEDLFLVPFPALMDSKGKYLIEQHTILTAPAIQVLELTRSQQQRIKTLPKSSRQNALIVGNPTMPKFNTKYGEPGKQLSSLPGAKREAQAIAPLFNTTALTGDEATETTIKDKLPQAGVIHLATHGLFDGFQGLQSSIALAPSSQDNGLLTASEILDIKLNADLVVLSACNTGRGRITGDGVIGLSRSLFLAGTPSVLVSLWSVPDAPTAELMTDFYQNLYQKNLDKAQALRQAMLKMKEQYPKAPRKWAAFTLIGEAE
ncbi:MAG: tetratricopeptide repeat protein [Rivularia sp. (in: Bacteria)]|nr:tetratricopeptide repeat protein [Rivularia sp. MS3]